LQFVEVIKDMNQIEKIKRSIRAELELFDSTLVDSLQTDNTLLKGVNEFVFMNMGKRLRPMLAILSAKLSGGVTDSSVHGAIALELLHTATLVHDDVVDDTPERRGAPSVNARWGNKVAVLSGDYMLAGALLQVANTRNVDIMAVIAGIAMELADGELLQLSSTQNSRISEQQYFSIIKKKTAHLFAACCEVGALSAGADAARRDQLRTYGENLGMCFQIKDDVFDYLQDVSIGKPTGNDLRDGKVTLPLIYALNNSTEEMRSKIFTIINLRNFTEENIEMVTRFAIESGGLKYAHECMEVYKNKAIEALNGFEDGEVKQALIDCAVYAVERQK
jgi:octaprenyl-diphosphate synthase